MGLCSWQRNLKALKQNYTLNLSSVGPLLDYAPPNQLGYYKEHKNLI